LTWMPPPIPSWEGDLGIAHRQQQRANSRSERLFLSECGKPVRVASYCRARVYLRNTLPSRPIFDYQAAKAAPPCLGVGAERGFVLFSLTRGEGAECRKGAEASILRGGRSDAPSWRNTA
jgi:hypothetical protein